MFSRKCAKYIGAMFLLFALLVPGSSSALDHDSDGKFDLTVFRPTWTGFSEGSWFVSSSVHDSTLLYQWGLAGDTPVPGYYSGIKQDRGADLAVWRPSTGVWYIRHYNDDLSFASTSAYQWGLTGDTPVPCDFDGDTRTDMTVFRNGQGPFQGYWFVLNSIGNTNAYDRFTAQQWGLDGDTPIPMDYDLDGKCDYTVYRGGNWYVLLSSMNNTASGAIAWGTAGDIPVPGQYDADAIPDFAVYRENTSTGPMWIIRRSTLAGLTWRTIQWGSVGDVPVPGDYTGDGKTDIAVFRPATGVWYVLTSESDYASSAAFQFGLPGDEPIGDR